MTRRWITLASLASLLLVACDGDPSPLDAGVDAGAPDAGPPPDAGFDPTEICDTLGLPSTPFDAAATGAAWEEVAGDFTVQTLDGPWTLSEHWSGCESYVFINWSASDYGRGLWASSPDELFTVGPRNVHYFFGAYDTEESITQMRAEEMRAVIQDGFDFQGLSAEDRAYWEDHIHYIGAPIQQAEGSVGELVRGSPIILAAFAITRQQRFDPVGSLMTIGGGGFTPLVSMARFAAPYYDYMQALDARIAADTDATVVPIADAEVTTERVFDRTVTLPAASAMAAFDSLEVDVQVTCLLTPDACSEWDRNAYVYVCTDETCAEQRELVHWITPYSRPGRRRWLIDATPLLGLLRDGGARTFRLVFGPTWEEPTERTVSVSLRLASRGAADRAIGAELAFTGGEFNDTYNAGQAPFQFTPPAGTTRVELVTILSGHGQTMGDNCAEWCNHVHTFTVNGAGDHVVEFAGQAGTRNGCADLASDGVPPGQWGNWSPLRAGWCPGLPVPAERMDITADVDLSAQNELTYRGSFMGAEPRGGNISLSAYVVYYQ